MDTCELFVWTVSKEKQPTLSKYPRKQLTIPGIVRTKDGVCCNGEGADKDDHCEYKTQQFLHLSYTHTIV